jgi:hypothetical protein
MKNGKSLRYYDFKEFTLDGEHGYLYVCEKFSKSLQAEVKRDAPFVQFLELRREYAPEMVSGCVFVPSWAERNTTVFYYLFAGDETWEWDYEYMGQTNIYDILEV